jgi:outer membrane protein
MNDAQRDEHSLKTITRKIESCLKILVFGAMISAASNRIVCAQNGSGQNGQSGRTNQAQPAQTEQPGQGNQTQTGEPSGASGTNANGSNAGAGQAGGIGTGQAGGVVGLSGGRGGATGAARVVPAPPTLDLGTAIQLAIQNNLATLLAQERQTEAQGFRREALAGLLPNISASAYQANLTINLRAQGFNIPIPGVPSFVGPFNSFDARVRLAQNIFNLTAIRNYQASKAAIETARFQEGLARQQVAQFAALAYLQTLQARESINAAQANLELAQSLLKLAQDQRNAGVATGVDVARAGVRVEQERVRLAQAQTQFAQAALNLQRIIGVPLGSQLNLTDALRFVPEQFPSVENAIATANANRFEIRIGESQLRQLDLQRRAIIAEQYPSLSFSGDYGSSGITPTNDALPTRRVQVQLNVPIFNGGLTRGRIAVAASEERQAQLQLGDVRGQVETDVRLALQTLGTTADQVRAAQASLDLARRELQLARDRFAAGVADNIEVINAQTSLANAQDAVVAALAAYNASRLNLAAALGNAESFRF